MHAVVVKHRHRPRREGEQERAERRHLILDLMQVEKDATRAACLQVLKARKLRKQAEAISQTDHVQSCEIIEQAMQIWPQSATLHQCAAQIYSASPDWDKTDLAVLHAKRALSLNPDSHESLSLAIELLLTQGRDVEACKLFLREFSFSPQNVEIIHTVRLLPGPKYRPLKTMMWQHTHFLQPWKKAFSSSLVTAHKNAGNDAASRAGVWFSKNIL